MKLIQISCSGRPTAPVNGAPEVVADVGSAYAALYAGRGFVPPWVGYLALIDGCCVGTCGFKAPPQNSRVEIGYFTFPEYEGMGVATQMARALVDVALRADPRVLITAQTRPEQCASTTILRKLGFELKGAVEHPEDGEVWEWHYSYAGLSAPSG